MARLVGAMEVGLGIGFLFRAALRPTLFLFFSELAGKFLLIFVRPRSAFQNHNPLLLTQEGKFVLKNLALFTAGLAVANQRHVEKIRELQEQAAKQALSQAFSSASRRRTFPSAQIFPRYTNVVARSSLFGGVFILAGIGVLAYFYVRSPYVTGVDVATGQPVPFSHQHHVGELGLDCRYCHSSVMVSSSAGMPSTKTCMTCHSQIWSNSAWLIPVQTSWQLGTPIDWVRVYDLPDFVYFNHSIHVTKGVGCETCHGRVDQMPLTWKAESLQMTWCLDCHSEPRRFLRPAEEVLTMGYQPEENQLLLGEKLVDEYHIPVGRLTDCYTCHR